MTPTATSNDTLPLRLTGFGSLPEALDYAARGKTGYNFYSARGNLARALTYAELRERAIEVARGFAKAGLQPGGRVVLVADTDADFTILFFACQYASLLGVPVALPTTLGGRDAYVAGVAAPADRIRRERRGGARGTAVLSARGRRRSRHRARRHASGFLRPAARRRRSPALRTGDHCYLQYSSGSTRAPLGVDVPQRVLMANCHAIINHGLQVRPDDRGTSWLPLYHDMGLVGFMPGAADWARCPSTTGDHGDFARRPLLWLKLMSDNRRHARPIQPYLRLRALRAPRWRGAKLDLDLPDWRVAGIGGDMVQPDILDRFADTLRPVRFPRDRVRAELWHG